jgi:hypothetical protein
VRQDLPLVGGVDGDRHRPEPGQGEDRLQELEAVGKHHGHVHPPTHPGSRKTARRPCDQFVEPVVGPFGVAEPQKRLPFVLNGRLAEQVVEDELVVPVLRVVRRLHQLDSRYPFGLRDNSDTLCTKPRI